MGIDNISLLKPEGHMFNYRLTDVNGKVLGVVSLESDEFPQALASGLQFLISCSYVEGDPKKILSLRVCPQPAVPAQPLRRYRRAITRRIDRVE